MRQLFAEFFVRLIGPLHGVFMRTLAYGPWGPLQPLIIRIFQRIFKIEWKDISQFKNLGAFFLRDIPLTISSASLVSPVEGLCVEGPARAELSTKVSVKGLCYSWNDFHEIDWKQWSGATFWNLYLAPHNYHWVHAACSGSELTSLHHNGKKWPVNKFGRWLCPGLYAENDRLTFQWQSPEFGRVAMICVGAMGVSSLRAVITQASTVQKAQKLLAFELGSTVLLLIERVPTSLKTVSVLKVGDEL